MICAEQRSMYSTSSAKMHQQGSMGIVTISGIVTPDQCGDIIRENLRWVQEVGVTAQLARCDTAVLMLDQDAMLQAALRELVAKSDVIVPCALVVQEYHVEMFNRYADQVSEHGVYRKVFTSDELEKALRWTARFSAAFADQTRRAQAYEAEARSRAFLASRH